MGAEFVDQADAPFAIAEADQTFAHQFHAHRRTIGLRNFCHQQEWRPVTSQQFAHECAWADLAKLIVLFTRHHGDVSSRLCYVPCRWRPLYAATPLTEAKRHALAA